MTTATVTVGERAGVPIAFKASNRVLAVAGWRELASQDADAEASGDGQNADKELVFIGRIENGERVVDLITPRIDRKVTVAPPRYNEGTLIAAMQEVWKRAESEEDQAWLKEAKGIGTPPRRGPPSSKG